MGASVFVPDFFTLPEAGRILRIGRNSAYKAATEFERTGGLSGLPFVRIGKLKRVPRLALEKLLGGPVTWPLVDDIADEADSPDGIAPCSDLPCRERVSCDVDVDVDVDRGVVELTSTFPPDQQSLSFEG
jgi:hypothetical protein